MKFSDSRRELTFKQGRVDLYGNAVYLCDGMHACIRVDSLDSYEYKAFLKEDSEIQGLVKPSMVKGTGN